MNRMSLLRKLGEEDGAIAVIAAAVLTVLLCFSAATVDLGMAYITASNLQSALDAAALAGAAALPDTASANYAALACLARNKLDPADVSVQFEESNSVITLYTEKSVPTSFLRVIGMDALQVDRSASASSVTQYDGVFDYRIFSGNAANTLTLGGTFDIDGSIHANGGVYISPSSGKITGQVEGCTSVYVNEWTATVGGILCPASNMEMPEFDSVVNSVMPSAYSEYAAASTYNEPWWKQTWEGSKFITGNVNISNGLVINGDVYIDGNFTVNGSAPVCVLNGNLYVNGDINFNNTTYVYGCVFATGDIHFRGSGAVVDTNTPVCIYSQNGDIDLTMGSAEASGIIYAPGGTISLAGNTLIFHGSLVGNVVSGIPANLIMDKSETQFDFLPTHTTVRLTR